MLDTPAPPRALLTVDDVAQYLGVKPNTVYAWRVRKEGPRAVKVGRAVRYRLEDVDAWLAGRPTKDASCPAQ